MSGTSPTSTSVGQNALGRRTGDLPARTPNPEEQAEQPPRRKPIGKRPASAKPSLPAPQAAPQTAQAAETAETPAAEAPRQSAAARLRAAAERVRAQKDAKEAGTAVAARSEAVPAEAPAARPEAASSAEPTPPGRALTLRPQRLELPPLPKITLPKFRLPRLRLLPAVVFCLCIMLGDRGVDLFHAVTSDAPVSELRETLQVDQAQAQTEEPQTGDAAPAADMDMAAVDPADATGEHAGMEAAADQHTGMQPMDGADAGPLVRPDGVSDAEWAVLQDLAQRREALDDLERQLDERAALLEVAEQRIDEKIEELHLLRDELEGLLADLSGQQDEQMASLVRIYETMRPGDAATIFNGLDMAVLLDVLQQMSERRSAPILAAMEPERARQVTAELALRRELPELPE
ncbi:MAG: hypothetical protein H6843_08155 [Rhodospirillaceae bacterium]|nr:hypothetical protein [Rhodospirillaceae bacterium]